MYFLDTNALYWYVGRDELGISATAKVDRDGLTAFLDKRFDKALAASAYVEALVKFRNNPSAIEKIHRCMIIKNLIVFNNIQYQIFSPDQIAVNLSLQGKMLSDYVKKKVLPVKIDLEVKFTIGFFEEILLLYTKYQIDNSKKICLKHDYEIMMFIRDKTIGNLEQELRTTLEDAYNNHEGQEEQLFKTKYIELMERGCQLVDLVIEVVTSENRELTEADVNEIEKKIGQSYNAMKQNSQQNYLMEHISNTLTQQKRFLDYSRKRISEMYSAKGKAFAGKEKYAFKELQISYLEEEMFVSWLEKKQKLRKNDIYDFFFLGCGDYQMNTTADNILLDNSTYLLSFDKKLARYIEKKRPTNGRIIRNFYKEF